MIPSIVSVLWEKTIMILLRSWRPVLIGLVLVSAACPCVAQEAKPLQVLFIGNSYTYGNDLPKMLAELAKAGGQSLLVVEKETPGGWSFKKHWEGGKAVQKIKSKKWDWVILQNHSLGALEARDDMFTFGKKLHELTPGSTFVDLSGSHNSSLSDLPQYWSSVDAFLRTNVEAAESPR